MAAVMDANKQSLISEPLSACRIPIAELSPIVEHSSERCIHASVTLLWPYSSSTKSLSLLLAEPDFRLRHTNGQVKVVFHGHIAEDVGRSQIGIGDSVYLSLAGARFLNNEAAIRTSGKSVAWDVHFDDRVFLEVLLRKIAGERHCLLLTIRIDFALFKASSNRENRPSFLSIAE
jgi:hypothetical protein